MRYADIKIVDVANGEGVRTSLFVTGCEFYCPGCFNSQIWSFDSGEKWTSEIEESFLNLLDRPYISGASILGGEPLHMKNVNDVSRLIKKIRLRFPSKTIWIYTGNTWETLMYSFKTGDREYDSYLETCKKVLKNIDVLVDGKFDLNLKDLTLKFRGSANQRIINVQESLKQDRVVLWGEEVQKNGKLP